MIPWPASCSRARTGVDRLYVGGVPVVRGGHLVRADEEEIAREQRAAGDAVLVPSARCRRRVDT